MSISANAKVRFRRQSNSKIPAGDGQRIRSRYPAKKARAPGAANETSEQPVAASAPVVEKPSSLLRQLLTKNPNVKRFTIRHIIAGMGYRHPEASLMLFSIPGVVPVPGTSDFVGSPSMALAGQMIAGREEVRLPRFFLERSVPRRALAVAIHTILPILERAESLMRPRWQWACTPSARRVIGLLVFLIALPLAFPFLGFNIPHAASLFTISIGLIEKDGMAVVLGVAAGIISLVLLTGANLSPKVLGRKAITWIKDIVGRVTCVCKALGSATRYTLRWISEKIFGGDAPRGASTNTKSMASKTPRSSHRHRHDGARLLPLSLHPSKEAFRPLRYGVSIAR